MRISDWSSDVCSSDLLNRLEQTVIGDVVDEILRALRLGVLREHLPAQGAGEFAAQPADDLPGLVLIDGITRSKLGQAAAQRGGDDAVPSLVCRRCRIVQVKARKDPARLCTQIGRAPV